MKKSATLLLIFFLLVVALGLYFSLSGKKGSLSRRDQNFRIADDGQELIRIEMEQRDDGHILIEKNANGTWWVNGSYSANESAVNELIATLYHLSVRLPVALADQERVNVELEQQGTLVSVFVRSHWIRLPGKIRLIPRHKRVLKMLTGKNTPDGESTYMRIYRSAMPFAVHVPGIKGGIEDLFSTDLAIWRNPVIIDLTADKIKNIEVTYPQNAGESFSVDLSGHKIVMSALGVPVDSLSIDWQRLRRYLGSFSELHYEKMITAESHNRLSTEMQRPHFLEIQLTDQEGKSNQMRFFHRIPGTEELKNLAPGVRVDPNRFFLQLNDGDFVLAQYFVFGRIMRQRSNFIINVEIQTSPSNPLNQKVGGF